MSIFNQMMGIREEGPEKPRQPEVKSFSPAEEKKEFWGSNEQIKIDRYGMEKKVDYRFRSGVKDFLKSDYTNPSALKSELNKMKTSSSVKERMLADYILNNLHKYKK